MMLRRVRDWFAFAAPDEDDADRAARLLRAIIWAVIAAFGLTLAFDLTLLHRAVLRAALLGGLGLLTLSLWLAGRGRLAAARVVTMLSVLGVLGVVLYTGYSGIHSVATMMLPAVIVIGALALPTRGFLVVTALTVLLAAGLVVADVRGFIRTPYHDIATYRDVIAPILFLAFTALMVRRLAAEQARSLARTRTAARALAEANQRLEEQAAALEQSEARWRAYLEQASDLVFILDEGGRFVSVNRAACEALGYASGDLIGRSALDLAAPEERAAAAEALRTVTSGGRIDQIDIGARARDGRPLVLELRGRTLREHGRVTGTFHIARDVTERRRIEAERAVEQARRERAEGERRELEARLQHAQKVESLGRLAGGIAHDFNNLLMAILGNIDVALDLLPPGSAAREPLLAAGKASGRATDLTRQMLAYAGRGKVTVEPFDLSEVIDGMADMLRVSVSKKTALRLDLAPRLPPIRGDVAQVRQVLMNLVINASEAIGDREGVITVSTGVGDYRRADLGDNWHGDDLSEGTYVRVEVSDTGPGMDEQTVRRVFDPFFTTKFTGRGLGLAVVLGIVRGHGAAVTIATEPGRGTTLRVLFPAGGVREAESATGVGAGGLASGSGTVLLVDDDESVRLPAHAMLERLGYQVIEAQDGRQAVARFAEGRAAIRCVLLDLSMPHMDGEETCRALRRLDPAVRVVISSGYGEQATALRFGEAPPAGFIQKPYTLQRLGEVLARALAGA
jgi:PAS domain S-box-containing protein